MLGCVMLGFQFLQDFISKLYTLMTDSRLERLLHLRLKSIKFLFLCNLTLSLIVQRQEEIVNNFDLLLSEVEVALECRQLIRIDNL